MSESYTCWKCGSVLRELILPMSRREQCPECHADQHVCKMCGFYRPQHTIFCDEERAEPPGELETANFCDYFKPVAMLPAQTEASKVAAAKFKLEALFGNEAACEYDKPPEVNKPSKKDQALDELNRLFGEGNNK
jgi:hypothetical protein